MAKKTVVIKCDEEGSYSIGEMPTPEMMGEGEAMGGMPELQPVDSLDEALEQAREMLVEGHEDGDAAAEEALGSGFDSISGEGLTSRKVY